MAFWRRNRRPSCTWRASLWVKRAGAGRIGGERLDTRSIGNRWHCTVVGARIIASEATLRLKCIGPRLWFCQLLSAIEIGPFPTKEDNEALRILFFWCSTKFESEKDTMRVGFLSNKLWHWVRYETSTKRTDLFDLREWFFLALERRSLSPFRQQH